MSMGWWLWPGLDQSESEKKKKNNKMQKIARTRETNKCHAPSKKNEIC